VPATAAPAVPVAPAAPDTGLTTAVSAQLASGNLDVSVRVASAGDNGAVTQTVSASADAAQIAPQSTDTRQSAPVQAVATQTAPSNVNVSIRIASPGADGPVTQTIDGGAVASAVPDPQYQPGGSQYQSPRPAPMPTTSVPAAPTPAPPVTTPAPAATAATTSSLPTAWDWTWTWTCGDITAGSTTQAIDTGIHGWVWTWTSGSTCVQPSTLPPAIESVNPTELSGGILPPTPPATPVTPVIEAPTPPTLPTLPTTPLVQAVQPVVVQSALATALPAALAAELNLEGTQTFLVPSAQLELPQLEPAAPLLLTVSAAPARSSVAVTFTAAETAQPVQSRPDRTTSPRRPAQLPPLPLPHPLDAPTAPASAGAGGAGGSGVAAALVVWLLVQLPGAAVLRRPPRHRTPRARVDDIRNRPG
jgi:hypothetical protein